MKHIAESLTFGLAALLATSVAPKAADWAVGSGGAVRDFGSIKDYRNAAVPVPAPTPSNTPMADWYIRADLSYNFATNADVKMTGVPYSLDGGNVESFAFGGIGAGRYLTPSVRAELTFDFQPKRAVTKSPYTFNKTFTQTNAATPTTTDTYTYQVVNADSTSTSDQTAMLNFYYDFHNGSRFTPYVGAGIGVDFKQLKRNYNQSAACVQQVNSSDPTNIILGCDGNAPHGPVVSYSSNSYQNSIGISAALMLGASYQVSEGVAIDTGYRMMWDGASLTADASGIGGPTNVTVSDRLNHEFRTGVRVDLN